MNLSAPLPCSRVAVLPVLKRAMDQGKRPTETNSASVTGKHLRDPPGPRRREFYNNQRWTDFCFMTTVCNSEDVAFFSSHSLGHYKEYVVITVIHLIKAWDMMRFFLRLYPNALYFHRFKGFQPS